MKAIGIIELGVSLEKGQRPVLSHTVIDPSVLSYHDVQAEKAAEEERVAKNKAALMSFYNIDPTTVSDITYTTGLLKRREKNGQEAPHKGALLTDTDVRFADGREVSFTMFVDAQTRVPEELAAGLGWEAERDAGQGEYFSDIISPESDTYYDAARAETEMYMAAWRAKETGAVALLMPEEVRQGADVIQLRPFMDETGFGAQEAVS